jgi:hypothetical protein
MDRPQHGDSTDGIHYRQDNYPAPETVPKCPVDSLDLFADIS